jgi:pimeloyl-ACP methyl ester carboxylesterase
MLATKTTESSASVRFATSADGTRLAFDKAGNGPALVIVGGALSHRDGGRPLAEKLAPRFTVYTYDRRGRGDSGDTKPYAVDREIEDLGSLIHQTGGEAYVYAVSSGAALALRSAARLGPSKVLKLAVYEPPYGQNQPDFDAQKARVQQLIRTGQPGDAAAFFLAAIGMPSSALRDLQGSPEWQRIKEIDFTLAYDYAVLGTGSVPESVAHITAPTLVLDGEKSLPFMRPTADRIAELIPNARRKTLAGQSHQAAPDAVAPLLIDFFGRDGD